MTDEQKAAILHLAVEEELPESRAMSISPLDHTISGRTLWVETLRGRLLSGQQVPVPGTPFLVRRPRQEVGQRSGPYVKCELGDQTGWIEAVWWDAAKLPQEQLESLLSAEAWWVQGVASLNQYGGRSTPQIRVDRAIPVSEALATPGLVRRSASSEEELGAWLSRCLVEVENKFLRTLLQQTLGEGGSWRTEYLRAPAGLYYHHAYLGGLADHVREMASMWLASRGIFPAVDKDLTLAGILLHDIGKLDTFTIRAAPQLARGGRFVDHITAGIARLSLATEALPGFPPALRDHLLHVLASHHGEKEHGSPVIPATREAIVVHHLDRLSSLLSHFEEWTRQSGIDPFGWTTEISPWLRVNLGASPEIPG